MEGRAMTHSFAVIPVAGGFKWSCSCGASGNRHEEHQRAVEFGSQHLRVERP